MIELLQQLAGSLFESGFVENLRYSRWSYALLNAAHIFGIGLLIGGILPLDLRLLGVWSRIPIPELSRILVPAAGIGLTTAIVTGVTLFSVRPADYISLGVFQTKLLLISIGAISAITLHIRHGWWLETAPKGQLVAAALVSMVCWTGTLIAGRLIGFMGN